MQPGHGREPCDTRALPPNPGNLFPLLPFNISRGYFSAFFVCVPNRFGLLGFQLVFIFFNQNAQRTQREREWICMRNPSPHPRRLWNPPAVSFCPEPREAGCQKIEEGKSRPGCCSIVNHHSILHSLHQAVAASLTIFPLSLVCVCSRHRVQMGNLAIFTHTHNTRPAPSARLKFNPTGCD